MNRITTLFNTKSKNILSVYFTAGYPALNDTFRTITELEKRGVDMIEIGIPFSDPIADGPVIQNSGSKALLNGMTLALLFEQLREIREYSSIPLVLMGYINPIIKMGMDNFLKNAAAIGIDGVIIPDLPPEEYQEKYREAFQRAGIFNNLLITPQSSDARIKELDQLTEGFLYMVSSAATTGSRDSFDEAQIDYFKRLDNMNLKSPRLIGFGISNHVTFNQACNYANGAIVGSAFIKALDESGTLAQKVSGFLESIR
ncbi:MAG: tryptophan synthase subunit alpha [Bacteroidales bacterium]|nr:tryptophan synthase subunit alpha [Bacteroidales bacterium]